MPHLLPIILEPATLSFILACILYGGACMVVCDLLSRVLPQHGEMPAGGNYAPVMA